MNKKSVIENPARLAALLKEKIAYDEGSVLNETFEYVARSHRISILRAELEGREAGFISALMTHVENGRLTIEQAAEIAEMDTVKFKNTAQEIKERRDNDSDLLKYKPLSKSELRMIMMPYLKDGYSIPAVAAYFSRTVERVEEITGLKSEVSQLEYDIINNLLNLRYDVKEEVAISAIVELINEGILSVSEAAERMKMNIDEFLTKAGLKEHCSSDGELMTSTSKDKIIETAMKLLSSKMNKTDIQCFFLALEEKYSDCSSW